MSGYSYSLSILPHVLVICTLMSSSAWGQLQIHFYRETCPQAEYLIKGIVKKHHNLDPSIAGGLLRLHFHDCFIRGCDASVLLDSTGKNVAEKEAPPNLTLRGLEIIDEIKVELEKRCKGVVSCADIIALATRDGVALSGGSAYALPSGRRDGTVSKIEEVNLPGPSLSVDDAAKAFETINMTLQELTVLLGAHGIGFSHCVFFIDTLYNFQGTQRADPDIDSQFLQTLRKTCPRPNPNVPFNFSTDPKLLMTPPNNPFMFDGSFYRGVLTGQAALQLDRELAVNDQTRNLAKDYINRPKVFRRKFAQAMIKLGSVGVLTGQQGEIRRNCRRVN